jgi:hypothetical protein
MGNKSTFVLLLMSLFCIQFVENNFARAATTTITDICGTSFSCNYGVGPKSFLCMSASAKSGSCVLVNGNSESACPHSSSVTAKQCQKSSPTQSNVKSQGQINCEARQAKWDTNTNICSDTDPDGTTKQVCISKGGDWTDSDLPHCCYDNPAKIAACGQANWDYDKHECKTTNTNQTKANCIKTPGKVWDDVNQKCNDSVTAKQCSVYSNQEEHPVPESVSSTKKEFHCVCKYANVMGKILEYRRDHESSNCPETPSKPQVATQETYNEPVLPCLEDVKNKINSCKNIATETIKTCDSKSEKNAKITQPVGSVMSLATQAMHTSAVNKGAAEQCKTAGYLSAASGYALGAIETNCKNELAQCQSTCADVKNYDQDTITMFCEGKAVGQETLLAYQAEKLAEVAEGVDEECFQKKEGTATQLLESVTQGVAAYISANRAAVQCEQTISSQPQLVPLTNKCLDSPNAAGCPVNCATNPTNAQCACITNPNAAGCKAGAGSQMAGNPNGKSQNLPSLETGFNSKPANAGGGGGRLDLDLGDASEQNPLDQKPVADTASSPMFAPAAAANPGSGGGTAGADGQGKNGKAGAASEEDTGLFGGVFQNLKNAAGSLFGSGGSGNSTGKKSSSATSATNPSGLKPVVGNKNLRGIASNGKSCFVDSKGAEFCFGKKNMDIFKMMNLQYNNQYNTLIIDK